MTDCSALVDGFIDTRECQCIGMLFFNLHDWDDMSWPKVAEGSKGFFQPVSPGYPRYFREVIASGARDISSHCLCCQEQREMRQFSLLITQPAFFTLQQFRTQPMKWCLEYSGWVFLSGLAFQTAHHRHFHRPVW